MGDLRARTDANWRSAATSEEAAEVAALDRDIARLAEARRELTVRRNAITNRCCVRAGARLRAKRAQHPSEATVQGRSPRRGAGEGGGETGGERGA